MWTVITLSPSDLPDFSYGPFKSYGAASKWACKHLAHLNDNRWFIVQHISQPPDGIA